uniref:NADH-ubiquinone oxidoreductase chain 6 n=1 Tax=Chirocentrus dorab TaxID=221863 RepID=A0A679BBI0_9TELE|nr:NADH dehydrogenase subunit 6 [Chirocentrus dorab]
MGMVLGTVALASNPAPYFAALGLVAVCVSGGVVLMGYGAPFLALVLFLIYLGGMLVVFAYSAALAAEPHPETFGDSPVALYVAAYTLLAGLSWGLFCVGGEPRVAMGHSEVGGYNLYEYPVDGAGSAQMYSGGGPMLMLCVWALLVALVVVLELTRGANRGAVRAV